MKTFLILLLSSVCVLGQSTIQNGKVQNATIGTPIVSGGGGTASTDNFTRADASPISNPMSDGVSTWSTPLGSSATVSISGNLCTVTFGGGWGCARVTSPTYSADQTSTITVSGSGLDLGPSVRIQAGSSSGYALIPFPSTTLHLYSVTDSGGSQSFSGLTTFTVSALAAGDTLTLSISGSTLTAKKNGTVIGTLTDTTWTTGQPGLFIQNSSQVSLFTASAP